MKKSKRKRRIARIAEVMHVSGLSKPSIYRLASQGKFPRPVPLVDGGRAVGWLEDEVEEWIEARLAAAGRSVDEDVAA